MKIILALLIITNLIGCSSKELNRNFALIQITQNLNQLSFKPNEFVYSTDGRSEIFQQNGICMLTIGGTGGGFDFKPINLELTSLLSDGIMTYTYELDYFGMYPIVPTSKGNDAFSVRNEENIKGRPVERGYIKLNDWVIDNISITGIKPMPMSENSMIVEFNYSKSPTNITSAGKSLSIFSKNYSSSAIFTKYDDGWRFEKMDFIETKNIVE